MKKIIIFLIAIFLLTGCTRSDAPQLLDEPIVTFDVTEVTSIPEENDKLPSTQKANQSIEDRFALIDFCVVSGNYSRNVMHDDVEFTEMFVGYKNNFVRVATNDMEQEVFAYNYTTDDFTYLYYFDGELMSKTVFNIETGAVLQDPEGYAELLLTQAEEIKIYFNDLLKASGLTLNDLQNI